MPSLDDQDDQLGVAGGVDDSVVTHPDAEQAEPPGRLEGLDSGRPWLLGEFVNRSANTLLNSVVKSQEVLAGARATRCGRSW
jgi:hypothetical protein